VVGRPAPDDGVERGDDRPRVRSAQLIRRGVHTSVQALENDIRDWIATWNDNPRPFTWTKTADEILASLADYLAKLGTGRETNTQD